MASRSKSRKLNKTDIISEIPRIQLPDDVISKILLPMSVKNLSKFRLVSKSWDSMISDPYFGNLHRNRWQKNSLRLLAVFDNGAFRTMDTKGNLIEEFSPLSGSMDDTIEARNFQMYSCFELVLFRSERHLHVCNPTTKEILTLPEHSTLFKKRNVWTYTPLLSSMIVGFGYISSTKKYKVMRVYESKCEVFTIGTDDSWRSAPCLPRSVSDAEKRATFGYGALHICYGMNSSVLRFDLEHEEWSVLPHPQPIFRMSYLYNVTELEEQFCRVEGVTEQDNSKRLHLWLLKDYVNNVWVTEHVINAGDVPWRDVSPLLIEEDGRILMKRLYSNRRRSCYKLGYFDANGTQTRWEEMIIKSKKKFQNEIYELTTYAESSLKLGSS